MRDPRDNEMDRPLNEEPGEGERRRLEEEEYVADEPVRSRPADQDLNRPLNRDVNTPLARDRVDYSGTRYGSTGPYSNLALTDMVRWGPIIAGFAATIALLLLMGVFGAAIGATSMTQTGQAAADNAGTFGVIWAAISLIVSFFVGGWLAARSAGLGGRLTALVNSSIVWAFTLLFLILLAGIGVAGGLGLSNSLGLPMMGSTMSSQQSATAAWGTLVGLVLAWLSAIVGGLVGMHDEPTPVNR
ncbi:MAG: YoaK family protein [Chloroflexota bacterium]